LARRGRRATSHPTKPIRHLGCPRQHRLSRTCCPPSCHLPLFPSSTRHCGSARETARGLRPFTGWVGLFASPGGAAGARTIKGPEPFAAKNPNLPGSQAST
jgi:hypothetical protein